MKLTDLEKLIPFYLSGKLPPDENHEVAEGLKTSGTLREDLHFWNRVKSIFRIQREFYRAGHLPPEQVVDYAEGAIADRRLLKQVEAHLMECSHCRDDLSILKETYEHHAPVRGASRSFIDMLVSHLPSFRFRYAIPVAAVIVVLVIVSLLFTTRQPEWQRLKLTGDQHLREMRYADAKVAYERSLSALSLEQDRMPADLAAVVESLAVVHVKAGDTEGARSFFERLLAIREENSGRDSSDLLRVLDQLAVLLDRQGQFLEAERNYRKAGQVRDLLAERSAGRFPARTKTFLALAPQIAFRGPEAERDLPKLYIQQGDVEMRISLGRSVVPSARYTFSVRTPSGRVLPALDTLLILPASLRLAPKGPSIDESGPDGERAESAGSLDSLSVVLSERYFRDQSGIYRLKVTELRPSTLSEPEIRSYNYAFEVFR